MLYNRSHWEHMDAKTLAQFAEDIFDYYRARGFPFYQLTPDQQFDELNRMDRYCKATHTMVGNTIHQTMHCLNVAWTYFPHAWAVRCNKHMTTPMEAFEDDAKFRKVIQRRLARGGYISDSGLRKALRVSSGMQGVSNFRPTAARAIYDRYGGDGVVWDMSCGYGGRLLGAISSRVITRYIGTDPDTRTYAGLMRMAQTIGHWNGDSLFDAKNTTEIEIHNVGSEVFQPDKESLDLCFTSPPYFNTEQYSTEASQSYIKFPTKDAWLTHFLMETVSRCEYGLKGGGFLVMNISNVKPYKNLVTDFVDAMRDRFPTFIPQPSLDYLLSSSTTGGYKREPVFVFRKFGERHDGTSLKTPMNTGVK